MKNFVIPLFIFYNFYLNGQNSKEFNFYKIDSLKYCGELTSASNYYESYSDSITLEDYQILDLVGCYAMINKNEQAFKLLDTLISNNPNYSDLSNLIQTDVYFLLSDKRWDTIFEKVASNYFKAKNFLPKNREYAMALLNLAILDQSFYYQVHLAETIHGKNSPITKAIWETKFFLNEKCLNKLDSLIQLYGWPNISLVGSFAASKAFLIIQHSELSYQIKYLPILEKAYEDGEVLFNWIAMLTDRILLRQKKPQKYGSQGIWNPEIEKYVMYQLSEPDSVNIWRERYELGPPVSKGAIENMYFPIKNK